ncbi:hypothetical protein QYE76_018778 [Lolium multiflorum]|uniref:Protein kinase domain-containing protein n=1 Tax=Lolium multiflorum TaxID=4521 RepID=A0AAD8QI55_LOLMU|nr:hypothetical protein QYE76_018778 [Lolium multiflorum]
MHRDKLSCGPFRFFWAGLVTWRPIFIACWPIFVACWPVLVACWLSVTRRSLDRFVPVEPVNHAEAARFAPWRDAMDAEMEALHRNGTWRLVPPRSGLNVIDSIWVYKLKHNANGSVDRYKARLVAKGFKQREGGLSMYFLIYVDDIIVISSSSVAADRLLAQLRQDFAIKDLGVLHYFLGIEVGSVADGIALCQRKYILDLLKKANMTMAKSCTTPMAVTDRLSKTSGTLLSSTDATQYRSIVEALQYVTLTRPDISYSVNKLPCASQAIAICKRPAATVDCQAQAKHAKKRRVAKRTTPSKTPTAFGTTANNKEESCLGEGASGDVYKAHNRATGRSSHSSSSPPIQARCCRRPVSSRRAMGTNMSSDSTASSATPSPRDSSLSWSSSKARASAGSSTNDAAVPRRRSQRPRCAPHDRNIIHQDIKPENILVVEEDGDVLLKICDFGEAILSTDPPLHNQAGSLLYCVPEVLMKKTEHNSLVFNNGRFILVKNNYTRPLHSQDAHNRFS